MTKWILNTRLYPRSLDFWLYLGLLCWIAIIEALNAGGSWGKYIFAITALCISQVPVLAFAWKKDNWKNSPTPPASRQYYLACFGVYLPLLALGSSLMLDGKTNTWEIVLQGTVCSLGLEIILIANTYLDKQVLNAKWVQRINLEKAILISLTIIALTLSAMAVSSLDNPLYDTKNQLLIGFEFSLAKVLSRFDTFLLYTLQLLLMYLCGYFFFLINSRILVSKVLKEKGIVLYILSALALVGIFYPVMGQLLSALPFSKRLGGIFSQNPFVWENAFGAIIVLLVSLPVLLAVQWSKQNNLIVSLEKEKAQAELDLLKQQLNPHFFFNTLNNLYALSLGKAKETPEVILQLADLMRYVIYKAKEPSVRIADEVQYLRDYVQLQSIRLKAKFDFRFETDIVNENFNIAPLLLIVPIENAFKHGIESAGGDAFLHITLRAEERKLNFSCENSFEPSIGSQSGIGLENLQKRLHLLYPGKHKLQIEKRSTTFKVELEFENDENAMPDH